MNGSPMDLLAGLKMADFEETLDSAPDDVALICMSPPYEDARTYGNATSWTFPDYQRLGDAVKRALKLPGSQCLMVLDGPVRDYRGDGYTERSVMPWRVLLDWKDRLGLVVPDRFTFSRRGYPGAYNGRFRCDDEPLLWFASEGARTLNKMAVAKPGNAKRAGQRVAGRRADGSMNHQRRKGPAIDAGLKLPGTVWAYEDTAKNHGGPTENVDHPARFPYRLARDLVLCFSNPGDLVVDPFLGSGTTMIAALDHERRFYGGDLLARQSDGVPWIDIARQIGVDRYSQRTIFDVPGVDRKAAEQVEIPLPPS